MKGYGVCRQCFMILILLPLIGVTGCTGKTERFGSGIFSWNTLPAEADLILMKENGMTEIYQYFKSAYTKQECEAFFTLAQKHGIDVYMLDGEAEWATDTHYEDLRETAFTHAWLHQTQGADKALKGIVLDVEPYVLKEWDNAAKELLHGFTENVRRFREENDITVYACIPYFYDTNGHEAELEQLIGTVDGIIIMNYYRGSEIGHMETEVAYAKQYGTRVVTAYDLKPSGESDPEGNNTYYKEGMEAVYRNFNEIRSAYPGTEIGLALHDIKYWKGMQESE